MNLESLANELLLRLFEYLRTDHLIHAFHDLNSRFNSLLFRHFVVYGIDFRSLSFNDFLTIRREYLSSLINKLPSLYLSEWNSLCQPLTPLYSYGFSLDQFVQLKLLSLSDLSHQQIMNKIKLALPHLINLTHLTLRVCCLPEDEGEDISAALAFINCIWSLPKLTHCYFDQLCVGESHDLVFIEPTMTSSSITHLSILGLNDDSFKLARVCKSTPNLQHFSISFLGEGVSIFLTSPVLSITSFELSLATGDCNLCNMLKWLPNICRLKVNGIEYISGHEWENIISNHLPKLKVFHFGMLRRCERNEIIEEQVDKLLDTFRTPFWLDKHGWFVRCEWRLNASFFYLYTLPYGFSDFGIKCPLFFKSTCLQEKDQQSYDAVRTLIYSREPETCSQPSNIQFNKLETLEIYAPICDHFWSMVPTFDHLTSCKILLLRNSEECKHQLQLLFIRAFRLSFLSLSEIRKDGSIDNIILEITNKSLKQLNLQGYYFSYNKEACVRFSNSVLAMQCEELQIRVKSRELICYLVRTMHNLRLLNVKCDDDKRETQNRIEYDDEEQKLKEDELVSWLQDRLAHVRSSMDIFRLPSTIVLRLS